MSEDTEVQLEGQSPVDEDRDQAASVNGTRTRTLTLKGKELRFNILRRDLKAKKSELSKAKRNAIMQKGFEDTRALKQKLLVAQIAWQDISELYDELAELLEKQEEIAAFTKQKQQDFLEWHKFEDDIKVEIQHRIDMEMLNPESLKSSSQKTKISSHCNRTTSSVRSMKLELKKQEAALRVQLAFAQKEKQLEREELEHRRRIEELKLHKKLAENQAQQEVIYEVDRSDEGSQNLSGILPANKDEDMYRFLNSQPEMDEQHSQSNNTEAQRAMQTTSCTASSVDYSHVPSVHDQNCALILSPKMEAKVNKKVENKDARAKVSSVPNPLANEVTDAMKQLVDSFRLPQVKLEIFSGNPLQFPSWESSFKSLIESKAPSVVERLNLLSQHLSGEPKAMVNSYLLLQTEEAFVQAKAELKDRYGNNTVIAKAFIDKLASSPRIQPRDSIGLRRFSDMLNEVVAAKRTIHDLGVLDYPQENAKLVAKIPTYIENQWRRITHASVSSGCFPTFERFALFVKEKAKEANIPAFEPEVKDWKESSVFNRESKNTSRGGNQVKARTFTTNVISGNEDLKCPFCKEQHHIDDCDKLMNLHRRERKQFFKTEGLCYACGMTKEHNGRACTSRVDCKKCSKKHLTALHYDENRTTSVSHCISVCNREGQTTDNSMIVPVWVRSKVNPNREILQYCVLDPQSNTCFISKELQKQLRIIGHDTELTQCK
ncbi:uncharacterized protein LOC144345005 [Saccoglossus kowalevskii]